MERIDAPALSKGRHELKFLLTASQALDLRTRIAGVLERDRHTEHDEGYYIQSVYLDDTKDSALYEKIDGTDPRKKYRLRSYGFSDRVLHLECKEKIGSLTYKTTAQVSRITYDALLAGDASYLAREEHPLCRRLAALCSARAFHPVVMVEYLREAYVYPVSNVRITFDKAVCVGTNSCDMFAPGLQTEQIFPHGEVVLEVKYDTHFPVFLRQLLPKTATKLAVSKFALCRERQKERNLILSSGH